MLKFVKEVFGNQSQRLLPLRKLLPNPTVQINSLSARFLVLLIKYPPN